MTVPDNRTITPSDCWHVASYALYCWPDAITSLRTFIAQQPDLQLSAESASGKLILLLDSPDEQAPLERLQQLEQQPGVIQVALVYHEIIDTPQEALPS